MCLQPNVKKTGRNVIFPSKLGTLSETKTNAVHHTTSIQLSNVDKNGCLAVIEITESLCRKPTTPDREENVQL